MINFLLINIVSFQNDWFTQTETVNDSRFLWKFSGFLMYLYIHCCHCFAAEIF